MDQAHDYMKEVGQYLQEREDIAIMKDCEQTTKDVIDEHIDMMEELNSWMLAENMAADKQMREMIEFQRSIGIEVEEPVLSIEGQKILDKEKKRKKKLSAFYDIKEDEQENEGSDVEDESENQSS